jgi:uncharacterized protein (TIGR00730 family)
VTAVSSDRPVICVFGSYDPKPGEPPFELAYDIGYRLARAGYDICNGGYEGTMLAGAKGAKDAGGSTIGVTCSVFETAAGQPLQPNEYIDKVIPSDNVFDRIKAMMEISAGFVVLPGGTGTLSEFAIAWEFVAKKMIEPRPIFVVGDQWQPTVEAIRSVRAKHTHCVHCVDLADEIVAIATQEIPLDTV